MRFFKWFITLFITISAFSGCGKEKSEEKPLAEKEHSELVTLSKSSIAEIKLETMQAELIAIKGSLSVPATVIPNQDNEALVGSLVQGRVHRVFVKAGDLVKAGQVMMTLEGLEIGEIKAGFLKAKANLEYYKSTYERQKKLIEQNAGSQKYYLEAQAEYEKALAEFKAEDKKIHSIGLDDSDVTNGSGEEHKSGTLPIKAPIGGLVVERNVVIGQLIEANTNAFRILNTGSVWVDGQVYEKDLDKLTGKSEISFVPSALSGTFSGRIINIGQMVDERSRTLTLRAEINNAGGRLKPQMFGEMKIAVGAGARAIMLPSEALVKASGEEYLFVQLNDSTFEKRTVKSGISDGSMIEIKEGLKPGERVVSKGAFYLKSEMKKDELGEE